MKQRIAIPTSDGTLDSHFGHCSHFTLFDIEGGKIAEETIIEAPPHQHGLLPRWLAERGVTDVVAGGMGERAMELLKSRDIRVFSGAPVMEVKKLTEEFLAGRLEYNPHQCHHH